LLATTGAHGSSEPLAHLVVDLLLRNAVATLAVPATTAAVAPAIIRGVVSPAGVLATAGIPACGTFAGGVLSAGVTGLLLGRCQPLADGVSHGLLVLPGAVLLAGRGLDGQRRLGVGGRRFGLLGATGLATRSLAALRLGLGP